MSQREHDEPAPHERQEFSNVTTPEEAPPRRVPEFGSDAVALLLEELGVEYVAINPGASFRGLHDSMVNFGTRRPRLLTCLHDEQAVAIAHGYAKAKGSPMAVVLHTNVGLMHASMAIFNAYCDRVPMMIMVGNGPLDAVKRRPWIDWIHTAVDLPALVRGFVKWDDVPISVGATLESLARAWDITRMHPAGPTCVVLDSAMQESPLDGTPQLPRLVDSWVLDAPAASADSVVRAVALLSTATRPVVLLGSVGLERSDLDHRVSLVEGLHARVITDLKANASFPSAHPANVGSPGIFVTPEAQTVLAEADVVLSVNWTDVAGTLKQAGVRSSTRLVTAGLDHLLANGFTKDHQARIAPDVVLPGAADAVVKQLVAALGLPVRPWKTPEVHRLVPEQDAPASEIGLSVLARELQQATAGRAVTVVRLPLGTNGADWSFEEPLDFLGSDGGAGLGSGPGMSVGAALALHGSGRLVVSVLGDGDYLMGIQALWTAVRERVPLLVVVANNHTYFNDEVHQQKVAEQRGRDASRRHIGLAMNDPRPDVAMLARAQGAEGIGPIDDLGELRPALKAAVAAVDAGGIVVVDVSVAAGYSAAMASGLTRE